MKRLALLGASGHAKVVAEAASLGGWDEIHLYDDRWPELRSLGPWTVAGVTADLMARAAGYDSVAVAIGRNAVRLRLHQELAAAGARLAAIVHPRAIVSALASIGPGTLVAAGAIVNPFAEVGAACIINTGASVDHDCVLADGAHVSPGGRLGGTVYVGQRSWIGIGASVKQGIVIGADVIVGAGAVVVSDVADGLTVVGVPARPRSC